MAIQEREDRFRELLLYVSAKCASHPKFGAVKLNKILFYSDFLAYFRLGEPITGVEYQKLDQGPAPRRLKPIKDEMIANRELAEQPKLLFSGRVQKRLVNLRQPKLDIFEPEQIALVDYVIDQLRYMTADEVSEFGHKEIGWKAAYYGETIPYATAFLTVRGVRRTDRERAKEAAERHADLLPEN
jgi:hypothetical protein